MTASDDLRAIADEYWEAKLEASPLFASFLGDHRYDDRADDLSTETEKPAAPRWIELRDRAAAVASGDLEDTDQVTRDLLVDELDDAVRTIDLRLIELASDQDARRPRRPADHGGTTASTRTRARPDGPGPDRRTGPDARPGCAALPRGGWGGDSALVNVTRSMHQVSGYLSSPLDDDPFVQLAGPDTWDGADAWRAEMSDAVRDILRPAFARYRDVYADELEPAARPDDRPGLCYLADGAALCGARRAPYGASADGHRAARDRPRGGDHQASGGVRRRRRQGVRHVRREQDLRQAARRHRPALPRRRRDRRTRARLSRPSNRGDR